MRLKNRFKDRYRLVLLPTSNRPCRFDYSASDFKAGVVACLSNPNFRKNWIYTIKKQAA